MSFLIRPHGRDNMENHSIPLTAKNDIIGKLDYPGHYEQTDPTTTRRCPQH